MTQYNSLNVKLSNSQLNKLKSSIKNESDVVLRIWSNMVSNSNDNTNFPHELLLTNRQVANIRKAFANHSSIDIKLLKTQLSKMIQSGGFLGNLLGKLAGPLMKVAVPLAKNVLAQLGMSAAMSAIDGSIKKKMLGSGMTTLIISNDEMNDILKIVKSLENFGLLLKGVSEKKILTLAAHPLTNFEIQEYYQNEPRFNGVFSRDNLPNSIKNGAYVINLDEYHDIGTHWVALYVNNKIAIYFDSFGVEHIPKDYEIY